MAVDEERIEGIAELVQAVLQIADNLPDDRFLWFRGMDCSDHALLPKLLRGAPRDHLAVFDREKRLITRFRQRSLPHWPAGYPQDDWEHMFMMQHHGVPTRLLDWSENLFVATYFAAPSMPPDPAEHDHDGPCTGALWCLDPVGWNRGVPQLQDFPDIGVLTTVEDELARYGPETMSPEVIARRYETPVALYGTHNSERIVAQRGTFTVAGKGIRGLEEFAVDGPEGEAVLWKFVLDTDLATLRRRLHQLGFSESMVFPDLSALARELEDMEGWR